MKCLSFIFSSCILFFLKPEDKSLIGEIIFNLLPIKTNLCKQFTWIKCCSLESSGKICLFWPASRCLHLVSPVTREPMLDRTGAVSLHLKKFYFDFRKLHCWLRGMLTIWLIFYSVPECERSWRHVGYVNLRSALGTRPSCDEETRSMSGERVWSPGRADLEEPDGDWCLSTIEAFCKQHMEGLWSLM